MECGVGVVYRVGMEIGANRASLCMADAQGTILCRRVFGAASVGNAERFVDTLCDHLEDLLLKRGLTPVDVTHIGIGVTGMVDASLRTVESAPLVFGESSLPLAAMVESRLGVMPTVMRDVWAAAAAELRFTETAAREAALCVTLGRGVGAALLRGGKTLSGGASEAETAALSAFEQNAADVFGSMALAQNARERFKGRSLPEKFSARDLFTMAEQNDQQAAHLLGEATDALADAMTALMEACGVNVAVISGVNSAYQSALIEPLDAMVRRHSHGRFAGAVTPTVRQAVFAADSVMVGAAFLTSEMIVFPA